MLGFRAIPGFKLLTSAFESSRDIRVMKRELTLLVRSSLLTIMAMAIRPASPPLEYPDSDIDAPQDDFDDQDELVSMLSVNSN